MKLFVMPVCNLLKADAQRLFLTRNVCSIPQSMKAWQIHKYGDTKDLTFESLPVPIIKRPSDVLIEVRAASINPIDTAMIGGYGSKAINALRKSNGLLKNDSEFPLTLGRDFSGKIVGLGMDVNKGKFKAGDEVWGTINAAYQGSFSQYLLVPSSDISFKPKSLSHIEAAAFPYVTCTTWAAISDICDMNPEKFRDKKVLILGGSGGVGTFAIQLFKAWRAEVTTTVSANFFEKAVELGAINVVDYKHPDYLSQVKSYGLYDLVYDLVATEDLDVNLKLLKPNSCSKYTTIVNPFLRNINNYGLIQGLVQNGFQLVSQKLQGLRSGSRVFWGLFRPNRKALDTVADLADRKKILPIIEKVFSFNELPSAMEKVSSRRNRGKTVVDFATSSV